VPLERGDVCYRFCEDNSETFVNRRGDCPKDAPCSRPASSAGEMSFDSCGQRAHVCGGAQEAASKLAKKLRPGFHHDVKDTEPQVRELQTVVDCETDEDNMYCCATISGTSNCLLDGIVKDADGCSTACQKRYAAMSWSCYSTYHTHFIWAQMAENCDEEGVVTFSAPTTTTKKTASEDTSPDTVGIAGAAVGLQGQLGSSSTTIFVAVLTSLLAWVGAA